MGLRRKRKKRKRIEEEKEEEEAEETEVLLFELMKFLKQNSKRRGNDPEFEEIEGAI
jgi:hypothetical protein